MKKKLVASMALATAMICGQNAYANPEADALLDKIIQEEGITYTYENAEVSETASGKSIFISNAKFTGEEDGEKIDFLIDSIQSVEQGDYFLGGVVNARVDYDFSKQMSDVSGDVPRDPVTDHLAFRAIKLLNDDGISFAQEVDNREKSLLKGFYQMEAAKLLGIKIKVEAPTEGLVGGIDVPLYATDQQYALSINDQLSWNKLNLEITDNGIVDFLIYAFHKTALKEPLDQHKPNDRSFYAEMFKNQAIHQIGAFGISDPKINEVIEKVHGLILNGGSMTLEFNDSHYKQIRAFGPPAGQLK